MMREYQRVLAAVDFSAATETVAAEAVGIARRHDAGLVFLHVVENFPEHLPHYRIGREDKDPEQFIVDRAGADLADLAKRLGAPDADREVRVTTHSARSEIVAFATEGEVDLVVIGARGRGGIIERLTGSTATGVVSRAPCDVLVLQESG